MLNSLYRWSTSQLAVLALNYIPIYKKLCKERQKQGGRDKESMGKGLKTTELAAKKVGVNSKIVADIHTLNNNLPEIIPLIKAADYEGLTVAEAKELKRQRDDYEISVIVADGKLSKEAEAALKEIRDQKKGKRIL